MQVSKRSSSSVRWLITPVDTVGASCRPTGAANRPAGTASTWPVISLSSIDLPVPLSPDTRMRSGPSMRNCWPAPTFTCTICLPGATAVSGSGMRITSGWRAAASAAARAA